MIRSPTENEVHSASEAVRAFTEGLLRHPGSFRGPMLRGSIVMEFELLAARLWGFDYCVGMCNATMALLTVAVAANLKGKEIIVAPHSWSGTYSPFEFVGVRLVYAGEDESGNLAPSSLPSLLTSNTAAVLAVDWQGLPHDSAGIRGFCDEHRILYMADSSLMPQSAVRPDVQIVSFGPGKPISLGEGGAVLTNMRCLYERVVSLSQHPERRMAEDIEICDMPPFLNGRMNPFSAVLGALQLQSLSPAREVDVHS